jgi:hypothetical protein
LYKKLNNKDYFSGGAGTMTGGSVKPPSAIQSIMDKYLK